VGSPAPPKLCRVLVTSMPKGSLARSPAAGSTAYPDSISFAGAVVRATGLSLRSPRPFQDLFLAENILTNRVGRLHSRPIAPAYLPAPEHTETRTPPPATTIREERTHGHHHTHLRHYLR
jgi:hypothetical protein